MTDLLKRVLGMGRRPAPLSYEQEKELARAPDSEARRRLAAREDLRPEIMYYLAEDSDPEVRQAIAENVSTPAQANLLLASDQDERVRASLAEKVARLAPGLTADEQDRLRRMTYQALELLVRDQMTVVRQVVAEALKDVAQAPPEVIRRLARDVELVVAAPVLEHSPVLGDDDLLDIINSGPIQGAVSAISRRRQVSAPVCDAIAETDDVDAIANLLANPSAQIREETLDSIIERAPDYEPWHAPLVRRPRLSARAAARLARFVAESLLEVLQEREDLDEATAAAVAETVNRRLEPRLEPRRPGEDALAAARRLHEQDALDEAIVLQALQGSDREFVKAALAVRAKLPLAVVEKAATTRSAKGVTALAWKAGLSMEAAVQLQAKLALIPPPDLLTAKNADAYPLAPDEMEWQIQLFVSMVRASSARE